MRFRVTGLLKRLVRKITRHGRGRKRRRRAILAFAVNSLLLGSLVYNGYYAWRILTHAELGAPSNSPTLVTLDLAQLIALFLSWTAFLVIATTKTARYFASVERTIDQQDVRLSQIDEETKRDLERTKELLENANLYFRLNRIIAKVESDIDKSAESPEGDTP